MLPAAMRVLCGALLLCAAAARPVRACWGRGEQARAGWEQREQATLARQQQRPRRRPSPLPLPPAACTQGRQLLVPSAPAPVGAEEHFVQVQNGQFVDGCNRFVVAGWNQ